MSTKALSSTLVCEQCVIGTLTHTGAHICALLETWSQPLANSINNKEVTPILEGVKSSRVE
eukprot:3999634-Ditylum_brightwellii.AAC.1